MAKSRLIQDWEWPKATNNKSEKKYVRETKTQTSQSLAK